jgi:hypothetical protein
VLLAPGVRDAWRFIFWESKIEVRHFHTMSEDDKPVTRAELRAELKELKGELKGYLSELQSAMSEQMRDIETALLRAFQNYAQV